MKDRWFGFEYQTEKAVQSRKKPIYFAEKPTAFGADFWPMMASGEVCFHSYDGILLLLLDLFSFLTAHQLHLLAAVKDILRELKTNLQHMLYAVVQIADKFPDATLAGLVTVLHTAFRCVPLGDKPWDKVPPRFRFTLSEREDVMEYFIDDRLLSDKGILQAVRQVQQDLRLAEFAGRQLTTDALPEFLIECFARFLNQKNQQVYDVYSFFDSPNFFEVCLKMRMSFAQSGFTFSQAVSFVQDIVFQDGGRGQGTQSAQA